jgi:hypothetical protein
MKAMSEMTLHADERKVYQHRKTNLPATVMPSSFKCEIA